MTSVSSSFSECFSATSYINGNPITNQLNLHLLPFERLDKITSENLCKMYLPGKVVVAQIHYDDMSFPRPGDAEVNFLYQFNQEIVVSFTLTPADYLHIIDKQNAMYELWYDVNLVNVNNSVNTIEHTKYNGTNCFSKVQMTYTIYGDIDLSVSTTNCQIPMSTSQVYLEFLNDQVNTQIQIVPCTSSCTSTEFKTTSTTFKPITVYRVRKTALNAEILAQFYQKFIENRRIPISLNVKFNKNGIYSVISRQMDKISAKDTRGCKNNGTSDSHLFIGATINPNNMFIQYRESLTNQMQCNLPEAVKVKVDLYVYDAQTSTRKQKTFTQAEFNGEIGVTFENDAEFTKLRNNFNPSITKSVVTVSFMTSDDTIVWELVSFAKAYIGCVTRATLHLYDNQSCLIYEFDDNPTCKTQKLLATSLNSLGIYYKDGEIKQSLGYYKFNYAINYTDLHQEVCFVCDQYVAGNYSKSTCQENQDFTKQKLKTSTIGFGIISSFESIVLDSVVAEYKAIYLPFIVCASIGLLFSVIITTIFIIKQTSSS
ncbi:Conserved_hypothetical protein [Hexamita inflata]|uniref:Uncharacterized protein n=1 Tax=Hexamita inflata TaxID=28002 RepID=A0AA86U621_9EUKA|nr:Conserved hypothetical protein [Hexamita inflata]